MFRGRRRGERDKEEAALREMASGPVDVDGIRSVIADVLATLPAGAAQVRESRGHVQQYRDAPEHDLDYLRLEIVPRAAGALDVKIDVYDQYPGVDVFVGESPPIELTAPVNLNDSPPRPFLDVIREVLTDVAEGHADLGSWPGGDFHLVRYRSKDRRQRHGTPDKEDMTWSAAAPWS